MAHDRGPRNAPLLVGMLILVVSGVATWFRSAPPDPLPTDAPVGAFSAGRAMVVLERLVGDGEPHPIGTDANARVRARLVEAFARLGYVTDVQETFACSGTDRACGLVQNVIARQPGPPSGPVVLLVSHYDSVAAGPGASDAGVSVAAILEAARALATDSDRRNAVAFLVTDGEEAGLLGASGFVAGHPLFREVGAVVNLEARGTSGPSVMFETSSDNAWLIALLSRSLRRPMASSLFYPIYERLPNDTDLTVFKEAGVPGLNFAFIGDVARYHSPQDDVAHASPASLQHQGENALAIVRALAEADFESRSPGNAVFFDVLGFGIVAWPITFTVPLAVAAFLMVTVATLVGWRFTESTMAGTAVGLVSWILALGAAALGTWRLMAWLDASRVWPGGATTRPEAWVLAFWLVGLACAASVTALLGRWSKAPGAWSGCWLGSSAAAIAAALYFPEASYVLVAPALLAGVSGVIAVSLGGRAPGAFASVLPLAVASALLMPPAWMLFDALGPPALPVAGSAIAFASAMLAPAMAGAGRSRWLVPVSALAAAAVLSAWAVRAPSFSPELPERMSITFFQLAGEAKARWLVSPQSGTLPEPLRAAAPFGAEMGAGFPWSRNGTAFFAEVDLTTMREPVVDVLSRRTEGARTTVTLRALSPRKAPTLALLVPSNRVVSARVNNTEIPERQADLEVRPSQREAGASLRRYACFTLPAGGVEIELVVEGDDPVEGFVIDQSVGLPPGGNRLVSARPSTATASGQGDITMLARRIRF